MTRPSLFSRFLIGTLMLSMLGAGCTNGPDAETAAASKRIPLTIWGVVDDSDAYDAIIKDFRALHPNVDVQYRRFRLEEYENELLNAMAEDRGPDIFLIHNTWLGKYKPKIEPMPASTRVAVQVVQGTLKKEVVYQMQSEPTISLRTYKNQYPDVVSKDFIRTINVSKTTDKKDFQERIFGVPMSVDTLAMYANKDLLNAAGVPVIPETWDAFQEAVRKIAKQDDQGNILQAGAAIGTSLNVERAPDIISALIMQNGGEMSADDGSPTFERIPPALEGKRDEPPSYQALFFYTDFANPGKDVYTWNAKMPNSLDAFISGQSAFFFGYSYQFPDIKARAPKLNVSISKLPQIQGNPTVNFANYWAWTVSKRTKNLDMAWNFVNFLTKSDEAKKFIDVVKRPAAIKAQLPAQLEDEQVGVFASQVLTSRSWYRGNDPKAADAALNGLIDNVLLNGADGIGASVRDALERVSQTITYE